MWAGNMDSRAQRGPHVTAEASDTRSAGKRLHVATCGNNGSGGFTAHNCQEQSGHQSLQQCRGSGMHYARFGTSHRWSRPLLSSRSKVQGIIMHKWLAHARRHLLKDIFLFGVLMALFISDLSMIGTTMGRSLLSSSQATGGGQPSVATADGLLDTSAYGIACTAQELLMLMICLRNLWYAAPLSCDAPVQRLLYSLLLQFHSSI